MIAIRANVRKKLTYCLDQGVLLFHVIFLLRDRYDAKTDTWTQVAPISSARDAVGVCLLGDRLYAVGGYDGQQYLSEVEAYDAQSNEWKQVLYV